MGIRIHCRGGIELGNPLGPISFFLYENSLEAMPVVRVLSGGSNSMAVTCVECVLYMYNNTLEPSLSH